VFAAIRSQTGSSANEFKLTGEQVDSTALQYLRVRYYDQTIGRFLARDPVPRGNLYAYVGNNPVNYVDPYGLFSIGGVDVTPDFVDDAWDCTTHPV
jgi:RHS repeat-associated protein